MYQMFKDYYPLGLFDINDCINAVKCGYFDKDNFAEITGQNYPE